MLVKEHNTKKSRIIRPPSKITKNQYPLKCKSVPVNKSNKSIDYDAVLSRSNANLQSNDKTVHEHRKIELIPNQNNRIEEDAEITHVYLTFTNYASSRSESFLDVIINFMSYRIGGNFTHVEPVFVLKGNTSHQIANHAFNVKPFKTVRMLENKDFEYERTGWRKCLLNTDQQQRNEMYNFCISKLGKGYDMNGLTRYFLPRFMQPVSTPDTWNCISLTLEMLKKGFHCLDNLDPTYMSVPDVYESCKENGMYVASKMPKPGQILPN